MTLFEVLTMMAYGTAGGGFAAALTKLRARLERDRMESRLRAVILEKSVDGPFPHIPSIRMINIMR